MDLKRKATQTGKTVGVDLKGRENVGFRFKTSQNQIESQNQLSLISQLDSVSFIYYNGFIDFYL